MRVARVQAQAKINQVLRVLQRDDATGYHDIVTLFERIDLADEVLVRAGGSGRTVRASGPCLPTAGLGPLEKNLAYRAAVEFADRAGWPDGFEIELTKNIPVGGGLGGGSADAGAVLRILNAIAPTPLTDDALTSAAAALGSDVPFLTKEWVKAIGMGRGHVLTNLPTIIPASMLPPPDFVVIVVPEFSIGTADAYRWLDEQRGSPYLVPPLEPIEPIESHAGATKDARRHLDAQQARTMVNDFEPVVEARFPELRQIRERLLDKGAFRSRLAGSGSCVFGLFHQIPPSDAELGLNAQVIRTRISTRVVQVQVLE